MPRPPEHSWPYRVYDVIRRHREPLLAFILNALETSGCRVIQNSDAGHAPFRISFETPGGERMGVLAYAFFANHRVTRNRPSDEYRFQLKYGGKEKTNIHELWQDPYGIYTTLLIGINPDEGFFVGFDPVLHSPTKHFISLEFKDSFVSEIMTRGWSSRERDRKRISDEPVEVIVGGTAGAFVDYIRFERDARGEDQGHRALLAERRANELAVDGQPRLQVRESPQVHALAQELELSSDEVLDVISKAKRLKMAVRGFVAEEHLLRRLLTVDGISDCQRIDDDGSPDIRLRYQGSDLLYVECKNVLRAPSGDGRPRVDFQRTRASKADPCSRYYSPEDFDVLAACLHARTERWEYEFALTTDLGLHRKCTGKLASNVIVDSRWAADIRGILGRAARAR